jgi:hypothetical protein
MLWSAARQYATHGVYVNPVRVTRKADGKKDVRPIGLWRNTSSVSATDISTWQNAYPDAGLLIDTGKSDLVVIDPDGPEGIANWLALDPSATARVRTPGGGEHWYYRAHPEHVIGNDQNGKVAPSVDVRGLGGFVIAPPSQDGTGSWEWIDGPPDWASLPVVPDLVIERMKLRPGQALNKDGSTLGPGTTPATDDLFDEAQRRFTREQAKDFIRRERAKLAGTTSGYNGAINNFAMACAHFPWLVNRRQCGAHMIKALGPVTGWTAPDDDDERTIDSAYSATESGKSWVAVEVEATQEDVRPDDVKLHIGSAGEMAYWLEDNAGIGRLSGFFLRDGRMVHTPRVNEVGYVPAPEGDNGPAEIRPVTGPVLAAKIQYLYRCYKVIKGKDGAPDKEVPALFPGQAASVAVDAPEALVGLRPLRGITSTPMVRADGSLLDAPGYDSASGFLFLPGPGVDVPAVPERPIKRDVERAGDLLLDMVQDFPFATPSDRANYLGLLLTPLLRQVAPPSYKLFGIGAHQPASGKSLLAEIAGVIHGAVMRSETPEDEAEWRKQAFSILGTTSAPLVVLDNIMGVLKSSTLAGILTAGREITDREMGKNTSTITVANDRVWVVTGNNLSLGGDMVRRTITILIDPDVPNPEQRTGFANPELRSWVSENRNEILWALLTLIRAWVAEGMPEPERKQSDSFAKWERVVAGILEVACIDGEFDAESGKLAAAGGDDDQTASVLDVLRDRFGDVSFSVAEALEPKDGDGFLIESRDWLPASVLDKLARSEGAGRKTLGWWFRNRIGRWVVTADGRPLVLREAPMERKVARWRIEQR